MTNSITTHDDPLDARLAFNLNVIMGEVLAPTRSRFERMLLTLRVPERWARIMAATPALRWSWAAAVGVVLVAAANAGDPTNRTATDIAVLLALAPIVPPLAVAIAYSATHDRAHQVHGVTPIAGLRLLLLRTVTVLTAAAAVTGLATLLAPHGGWWRLAWLLPAAATTAATLAGSTRWSTQRAALVVAAVWLTVVVVVNISSNDALAAFGLIGQLGALAITVVATARIVASRRQLLWSRQ